MVRTWCVLYILTSKCASRHNGVHFFDIATSKSGPNVVCFVHFDFEMCFAPQRRALFRHRNFQKSSDNGVFWTFWLRNVLRATTACTFSTSQLPKVVRQWCVLYILTCKCASRHNGVQFFISHLASWLRTRRFSEPTFRPSGAPNHCKNTVFRDFPTFSRQSRGLWEVKKYWGDWGIGWSYHPLVISVSHDLVPICGVQTWWLWTMDVYGLWSSIPNGYWDGDGASPQNLHKKGIQNQLSKIMVVLLHFPG